MINPQNPFSLQRKTILVTGASSGIGKAVAISCAELGAMVYITGRNESRLSETLTQMPGKHEMITADLTNVNALDNLVSSIDELDGVVHCAGVGNRVACKQINQQELSNVLMTNFEAPVLLQAKLLKERKIKKEASIVFIASRAANAPSKGNAIYSASKGAIISYSKCLALELSTRKIRVNSICPGMVWTDLILKDGIDIEDLKLAEQKYPLKRYGRPEDIAYLCVYLLSDASSWMTGSAIDISGGGEGILTL